MSFNQQHIVRDVQNQLFSHPAESDLESLFHQALDMLEETNYCDFEVRANSVLVHLIHSMEAIFAYCWL